jgi:hypothetical protein
MSLQKFKANMLRFMQNQEGLGSSDDFASKLTSEYNILIKSGFQTINNVPLQTGNTQGMESFIKLACLKASSIQEGQHNFLDDVGNGIINYWLNATLIVGIPPVIPAIGSIANITTTSTLVISPGQWTPIGPLSPNNDSNIFLSQLIAGIQSHLSTIQFLYNTISLYPSVPAPITAPGILQSTGYTIPG